MPDNPVPGEREAAGFLSLFERIPTVYAVLLVLGSVFASGGAVVGGLVSVIQLPRQIQEVRGALGAHVAWAQDTLETKLEAFQSEQNAWRMEQMTARRETAQLLTRLVCLHRIELEQQDIAQRVKAIQRCFLDDVTARP